MAKEAKNSPHISLGPSQIVHLGIDLPGDMVTETVCGLYVIFEDVFGDSREERWVLRSKKGNGGLGFTEFESGAYANSRA